VFQRQRVLFLFISAYYFLSFVRKRKKARKENMFKVTGRHDPEMWSNFFKMMMIWYSHTSQKEPDCYSPATCIKIILQVTVCNFEMEMKL